MWINWTSFGNRLETEKLYGLFCIRGNIFFKTSFVITRYFKIAKCVKCALENRFFCKLLGQNNGSTAAYLFHTSGKTSQSLDKRPCVHWPKLGSYSPRNPLAKNESWSLRIKTQGKLQQLKRPVHLRSSCFRIGNCDYSFRNDLLVNDSAPLNWNNSGEVGEGMLFYDIKLFVDRANRGYKTPLICRRMQGQKVQIFVLKLGSCK